MEKYANIHATYEVVPNNAVAKITVTMSWAQKSGYKIDETVHVWLLEIIGRDANGCTGGLV